MLPLAVFLCGAVLVVAFRVWVLVPASLAALIPAIWTGADGASLSQAAAEFIWLIAALQAGYLLGMLSRIAMFAKPAPDAATDKPSAEQAPVKSTF
jgi:hypothetical protein